MRAFWLRVSRACAFAIATICIFVPAASAACEGADAAPAPGATGPETIPFMVATNCALNEARAAHGLAPLTLEKRLTVAAYWHAVDMTSNKFFDHGGSDGKHAAARGRAQGYGDGADSWVIGETLGWGEQSVATPNQIVEAWLASPTHRPVVLNPEFRDVGIVVLAVAPLASALNGVTYVADFGAEVMPEPEVAARPKARKSCRRGSARKRARCAKLASRRAAAVALQAAARR